jgi:hypothetical protein
MKQATNPRRGRNRNSGKRNPNQNSRNRNYDGSGQENRVRGSSQQILDKFLALARDASLAGDRIATEGFYQHAEHYYRVLNPEPGTETTQGGNQQDHKPRYEKSHHQKRENQPRPAHQQPPSEQVEASVTTAKPVAEVAEVAEATTPEPVAEVSEVTTPEPVAEVAEVVEVVEVVEAVETPASKPKVSKEEGAQEKPRRRGRPRKVATAEPAA